MFSREERRDYAIRVGGLVLERGLQNITWDLGNKVKVYSGVFDIRIWHTLIVAGVRLAEVKPEPLFSSVEKLQDVFSALAQLAPDAVIDLAPCAYFTDTDYRRILKKPSLSSKQIEDRVLMLPKCILDVELFKGLKLVDKDGNETWNEYDGHDYHGFGAVRVIRRRPDRSKRGRGAGKDERAYWVYFNSMSGLAFWHNIAVGGYSLIKNENGAVYRFLRLSEAGQMIACATFGWNTKLPFAIRSFDQLLTIVRWIRAERPSDLLEQKKKLARVLDELVDAGFISSWRVMQNGAYCLIKRDPHLNPRRTYDRELDEAKRILLSDKRP